MRFKSIKRLLIMVCLCQVLLNTGYASETDNQAGISSSLFPGVTYASIATESEKPTSEAPAVISVITAEDLHNHGITSLEQALEEIPGVYSPYRFLNGNFVIRGIQESPFTTPEVLLLVDGVPQHDIWAAVLQFFITRIPVGNIKRIEIIRGPGSAIYGADAFAGVINVITKTDKDYEGHEFRGRVGSYDMAEVDAVLKGKLGNLITLLSIQVRSTDGHAPLIEADAQTLFDSQFGTSASLAPGKANTYFDEYNIALELISEYWRTRFQVRDHELGMGLGLLGGLTDGGNGFGTFYNIDTFYDNPVWRKNWRIKTRINLFETDVGANKPYLPPGAFDGEFPDGLLSDNSVSQRHQMIDIRALYNGPNHHDIMFSVGYIHEELYDNRDADNFNLQSGGVFILTPYTETPDAEVGLVSGSRSIKYFSAHDDWNVVQDIIFSLGARYDDYSNFGGIINPRLALIWLASHDMTVKLIANRAFRAPIYFESSSNVQFVAIGDPDIEPTVVNTFEVAFEKRFFHGTQVYLSIFSHTIKDNIEFTPPGLTGLRQVINSADEIVGNGAELETKIPFKESLFFKGSYSYQNNERESAVTSTVFTGGPHHKVYAGVDWQFMKGWNLYTNILWVDDFTRDVSDPRDDLGSDTFVNAVLRYTSPTKRWDSVLSVRNIFDEVAVSPTNSFLTLPNDIPLPGTNYMLEVRYRM